jgi:hypothetical protein
MLIAAIPFITILFGEPKMNNRLIVNININFKAIREAMMSIMFVAPPFTAES